MAMLTGNSSDSRVFWAPPFGPTSQMNVVSVCIGFGGMRQVARKVKTFSDSEVDFALRQHLGTA
jgi:hypothetical protein